MILFRHNSRLPAFRRPFGAVPAGTCLHIEAELGGDEGAIVSEFSTASHDETDIFTDPRIVRAPKVEE